MKNFKFCFLLVAAVSAALFTSCSGEEEEIVTVNFEDVDLGGKTYWNGSDLSGNPVEEESYSSIITNYYGSFQSGSLVFENRYTAEWFSWTGFAVSSQTDKNTAGIANDLSVYAAGGASGSKFAVFNNSDGTSLFSCRFSDGSAHTVKELKLNNATYTYLAVKDGNDGNEPPFVKGAFTDGDWFRITITGYNGNNPTGTVDYYLADFRNGKQYVCSNWTAVNLETLGQITGFSFSFGSSDGFGGFINTPAYVCIDDIKYIK